MNSQLLCVQSFLNRHSKAIVAFFFCALLLSGFATVDQYGHAWDDLGEVNILRMSLKEYAQILPFENRYAQALNQMDLSRISESIERDHGICLYYPVFWAVLQPDFSMRQISFYWRCHTWLLFCTGLFALYAIGRRMGFSRGLALLCVCILLLSPRLFAEGHYNNKDIPLMSMVLVLLWQTARLMDKPGWKSGIGFALAAGFCAGTRVIGVAFCGLFGLMIILHLWKSHRLKSSVLALGAGVFAGSVLFYCLLTPSFLADPFGFVQYLLTNAVSFSRWNGSVLFFGNIIPCAITKPSRLYLPVFILLTTPLWALVLLAVGSVLSIRKGLQKKAALLDRTRDTVFATAFLAWVLPLLGLVMIRALVYNGWRHVYFLYGPMVLTMGYALHALYSRLQKHCALRRVLCAALAVCMTCTGAGMAVNHPHQYAYFNILVPGVNRAELFEMDYWNLSFTQACEELLAAQEGTVYLAPADRYTRSGAALTSMYLAEDRLEILDSPDDPRTEYVISNLSYAKIHDYEPADNLVPFITVSSYGSPVTVIYRVTEKETP